MSAQCDIARLALRKRDLQEELEEVRDELKSKCADIELPFGAEINDQVVTVKRPPYRDGMPQITIAPLHGKCDLL